MIPPTTTQQKGLAFAPMPFAIASFFSSSYLIFYLLFKERHKLQRLYHRLVLSMNIALLPLSFTFAWSTFAVPAGTPYYYGASGTIGTCTAQGFMYVFFGLTVSWYYVSLSLQAFMGIKNNFKEEKYRWIEKYIHMVAFCHPLAFATIAAATQNLNPISSGCATAKYPLGCDKDPDIPCQRGKEMIGFEYFSIFSMSLIYFILPPSLVTAMYCWIRKLQQRTTGSAGMQRIRDYAQKQMMKSIAVQISLYLFLFWLTFVPLAISLAYFTLKRAIIYELSIFGNCIFGLQGFTMAVVYFSLQKLGKLKVGDMGIGSSRPARQGLTVQDIRLSVQLSTERQTVNGSEADNEQRSSYVFNIFDGEPDEDSPWARFIDQDDYDSDDADGQDERESAPANEGSEQLPTEPGADLAINMVDGSVT